MLPAKAPFEILPPIHLNGYIRKYFYHIGQFVNMKTTKPAFESMDLKYFKYENRIASFGTKWRYDKLKNGATCTSKNVSFYMKVKVEISMIKVKLFWLQFLQ